MPVLLTTTFLAATCILWSIARFLFRRSPLDNVRGPPSQSIWTGNFKSLFDTDGWKFHAHIAQKYGKVARIEGPMRSQLLYVFDPLALHHIIVKDQPIYSRNTSDLLKARSPYRGGDTVDAAGAPSRGPLTLWMVEMVVEVYSNPEQGRGRRMRNRRATLTHPPHYGVPCTSTVPPLHHPYLHLRLQRELPPKQAKRAGYAQTPRRASCSAGARVIRMRVLRLLGIMPFQPRLNPMRNLEFDLKSSLEHSSRGATRRELQRRGEVVAPGHRRAARVRGGGGGGCVSARSCSAKDSCRLVPGNSLNPYFLIKVIIARSIGEQHQRQRKSLNPAFSNVHLRQLAPVFYDVAHKLRAGLASKVIDSPAEIDILHAFKRCALELIGRGGLGYSFDNLKDDNQPVHPYSEAISGIQPLLIRLSLAFRFILPWASKIGSPRFQRAIVDWVPWKALHQFRDTVDLMNLTTQDILETKKRALSTTGEWSETHNSKDIISILMQTNARAGDNDRLPDTEILGQVTLRSLSFLAVD
ncbi:hypothetical protein MSAN_01320700 [Mycena sanguinolenta]|uniref:Cytochrome P450 n=1 Tax=Mycena sanguinolenta TaxID=230812 RepID=A0A8H6YA69_9AGAR|nr:hypothetical protein MSAN_01320700 [Mycena sanguinolenta]